MSKSGLNVLALGKIERRKLSSIDGQMKMIHSLDSKSFLKVDKINYVNFKCQDYNNRIISIEQEDEQYEGNEKYHTYREIYKVKIHEITLRELLILQSFYLCKTQSDIVNLVQLQPNPTFFYKTFLELNTSNMASILAFDSRAISYLLQDDFQKYFSDEFPIIYKNKIRKKGGKGFYYLTAIDAALKTNQVKAVNELISYIVKYQNNFVSSYLFLKNLPILMDKAISVKPLLDSDIFSSTFDFDGWPGNHSNDEECNRFYKESFYKLHLNYQTVFPEAEF